MKQYAVEYWGFMTILAESEQEARDKFAKVDHGPDSDYAEISSIDFMCVVHKRTSRNRLSAVIHRIQRVWKLAKALVVAKRKIEEE